MTEFYNQMIGFGEIDIMNNPFGLEKGEAFMEFAMIIMLVAVVVVVVMVFFGPELTAYIQAVLDGLTS